MSLALSYGWGKARRGITHTRLSCRAQHSAWFGSDSEACVLRLRNTASFSVSVGSWNHLKLCGCGSGEPGGSRVQSTDKFDPNLWFADVKKQAWAGLKSEAQDLGKQSLQVILLQQHQAISKALSLQTVVPQGTISCLARLLTLSLCCTYIARVSIQIQWNLLDLCIGTEIMLQHG